MKTLIVLIAVVFAFGFSDDKKQVEQKYDVTITVTYSAKSLTEAAALEMRTRRVFEDAGSINIQVGTPQTFQAPSPIWRYFDNRPSNFVSPSPRHSQNYQSVETLDLSPPTLRRHVYSIGCTH